MESVMRSYVPIEYPKWIDGVVVQNAAEEQTLRATMPEPAAAVGAAESAPTPSAAGIRMRRTRERRREGKLSIRCDVSIAQIEALALAGYIDPALRDDIGEVARGVAKAMDFVTRSVTLTI
jgi:hypothetical protein